MTFQTRADGKRKRVSLWVTIQGIETIFKETDGIDASSYIGESRDEVACLYGVTEGQQTLDYGTRSVRGGGLSFKIKRPRDGSLDSLFNVRSRPVTFIADPATRTQTSIAVVDDSFFSASGGIVFIGSETIYYAGVSGTDDLTGLVRGKFGSLPQAHAQVNSTAASTAGAGVYLSPPAFAGRRVTLYASFLNDDGTDAATEIMGTFSIEKSPLFDKFGWSFECAPLADEIAQRTLYSGVKDTKIVSVSSRSGEVGSFDITFEDTKTFSNGAPYVSHLLLTKVNDGNNKEILAYVGEDGDDRVFTTNSLAYYFPLTSGSTSVDASAKHICMIGGNDGRTSILSAILSVIGDGSNGGYDVLPGYEADDLFDEAWRMGAAIPEEYVDTQSFNSPNVPLSSFVHPLSDSMKLVDLLASFCFLSNTYWYTSRDGLLSVKPVSDVFTPNASIDFSISDENTIAGSPVVSLDEGEIFSTMSLGANYDPSIGDFSFRMNISDQEVSSKYINRENPISMDLHGLYADTSNVIGSSQVQRFVAPGAMSIAQIDTIARGIMRGGSGSRGRVVVNLDCSFDMLLLSVGDATRVDVDELPNLEGGSSISGTAEVISRRVNWDKGTISFGLRMREPVFAIAPFFLADTRTTTNIANDTLTSIGGAEGEGTAYDFFVGQTVFVWPDLSYTSTSPQSLVISAIPDDATLVFTSAVSSFTSGETWVTWADVGTAEGTDTASGFNEGDLAFNVTGPQPGSIAEGEIRRWK